MMKRFLTVVVAVLTVVLGLAELSTAADSFGARLRGTEETPVPIATAGQGFFLAVPNASQTQLDYTLVYFSLGSSVTQAHIHFGPPGISGGIVLFLCTNLTPPAGVPTPPACPNGGGVNSVSGTLTAANVIAQSGQGIVAGAAGFEDVIDAMRGLTSYANVHTTTYPGGEIRGIITH
jgi:CHRD domain